MEMKSFIFYSKVNAKKLVRQKRSDMERVYEVSHAIKFSNIGKIK